MNLRDILDYEVRSSWWAWMVSWGWLQGLACRYFAGKIKRKYARYLSSMAFDEEIAKRKRETTT